MFEITTSWIGPLLIGIAVAARPYVLNYFKQNGAVGNSLYFLLVMIIVVPLQMYQARFTLTSLDDASAKELVKEVLKAELLKDYENPKDVLWKPYDEKKKLYNVEAKVEKEGKAYRLYLQPECEFFKGCQVGLDKVVILPENSADNRAVTAMDEGMFLHRSCADQIALKILTQQTLPGVFKILFEGLKKVKKSTAEYEILTLAVDKEQTFDTKKKISYKEKEFKLGRECKADMSVIGKFTIKAGNKDITKPILSYIFDNMEKRSNNIYALQTPLYYNIYYKEDIGNIQVVATFIDKNKKSVKKKTVKKAKDICKDSALYKAVERQNFAEVKELVDAGCSIDGSGGSVGFTPLMLAAGLKNLEIVMYLVEHGANVHYKFKSGLSVLFRATMSRNPKILEYIITHGAKDEVNRAMRYGCTPLDNSLRSVALQSGGTLDNAKILLKYGAKKSINAKCKSYTPLMVAVPDEKVTRFLLENGADKRLKNQFGKTAYDMAKGYNVSKEYLELLKP